MKGVGMMENNKKNGQELTERYLYAVTKRLPGAQRADIEKELRGLIEDMLADTSAGAEPTQRDVEAVLLELGKPAELAAKYRGTKNYLIGPDLYNTYFMMLKIVLAAVAGGLTIALVIEYIVSPRENLITIFGDYLSAIFGAGFQVFAWVTIGFAVAQKYNAKIDEEDKKWSPAELPEVPAEKARIKKSEPIAGIVITVFFLLLFFTVPNMMGIFSTSGGITFVPFFDATVFNKMLPLIGVVFGLEILKDFVKLIVGKYNLKLAALITLANTIGFALMLYIFLPSAIWNAGFIESLQALEGFVMPEDLDIAYHWTLVPLYFSGILAFAFILNTVKVIVKAVRFNITKK